MQERDKEYVTAKEAMQLTGYSRRSLDRFIADGSLELIDYQKRRPLKISRASIDAFNAEHKHDPVDPLKQVKEQLAGQKQVNGDIVLQIATLRKKVAALEQLIQQLCAGLEGKSEC